MPFQLKPITRMDRGRVQEFFSFLDGGMILYLLEPFKKLLVFGGVYQFVVAGY